MQLEKRHEEMIVDEVIQTLERVVDELNSCLDALEVDDGITVIKDMDPDKSYPVGTLANVGGGCVKRWTGEKWDVISRGVEEVKIENGSLVVEYSDGRIQRSPIITKAARSKPVKVAA